MALLNPWHEVSVGADAPRTVNALIEISKGQRAKYELCKESGLLKLDRVLHSPFFYPANYGLIPQTLGEDKDPLDIFVLSQIDIVPMCLVEAHVIGVVHMLDNQEGDDKIIAVAKNDPTVQHFTDIKDIGHLKAELRHFFEQYKVLEKKEVQVEGFSGKEKALEVLSEALLRYRKNFKKK